MNSIREGYTNLDDTQKDLYDRLENVFSQAGITDVGSRLGVMLNNETVLGRFLSKHTDLSYNDLDSLYEALGAPEAKIEAPEITQKTVSKIMQEGSGAKGSGWGSTE